MMTLSQALRLLKDQPKDGPSRRVFLACGFQPLHLLTFLKAELATRSPGRMIEVPTGLYGDLEGTLAAAAQSGAEAAAVVVEWSDLDPRLGLRSSGGWGPSVEHDVVETCREQWRRILTAIAGLASRMPVVVAGPSLAPALFGHSAGWQLGAIEAELGLQLAGFLAEAARQQNVTVLHPYRLARSSPETGRVDVKMELAAGFPYSLAHASELAAQLANLLYPATPMKGLITDLDDTLWSGIVGEVGVSAVCWRLDSHAQIHGLYQQQLRQLSEMGVLLGVVSKNEPAVAEEALGRADLYLPKDALFPVRAGWKPKSQAVREILATWNVGPESVVFVDDSPMELDEVKAAFPAMTCLQFPSKHPGKALALFEQLKDLFGKRSLQREDGLRQASIRANAEFQLEQGSNPDFIRKLNGLVIFDDHKDPANKRLLELVNKTNQFNLNGLRLSEGEWRRRLEAGHGVVLSVAYEDKFGPLGVIGVATGELLSGRLTLDAWVLSCRAFSRRIEHHTLDYLFERTGAEVIALAFRPTERNQPLREFLHDFGLQPDQAGELEIHREGFRRVADLPHRTAAAVGQ